MAPFDYPRDRKSAERALYYFSDFATNSTYHGVFQEAVYILYGRDYEIKTDLNKRMNFFCVACNKTMNSTQALTGHNNSAHHLKNTDRLQIEQSGSGLNASNKAAKYSPDSIQYQIVCSNVKILGVHLIEAYVVRKHYQPYYKCLLCGSHGKREAIYKHIIGDKHTDKYIKYSVQLENCGLTTEHRNAMRVRLAARDGVDVDKIKTISDKHLYPVKWENEGLSEHALLNKYKQHRSSSPSHRGLDIKKKKGYSSRKESRSPSRSRFSKYDEPGTSSGSSRNTNKHRAISLLPEHDDPMEDLTSRARVVALQPTSSAVKEEKPLLETPGGVIIHRDTGTSTSNQEMQVYTEWAVERCLMKLNFRVHTHHLKSSDVISQTDAKECLELMFSVGNMLHFVLQKVEREHAKDRNRVAKITEAVSLIKKMQGQVVKRFAVKWNEENPGKYCIDELSPREY